MEGDASKPLLAASTTSDDIPDERARRDLPRGAPPTTKEHPAFSSSPSPPPAAAAGTPAFSSSPSPPPPAGIPDPEAALSSSELSAPTADPEDPSSAKNSPVGPTPTPSSLPPADPQARVAAGDGSSSSARHWWNFSGRVRPRGPSQSHLPVLVHGAQLPVPAPRRSIHESIQALRRQGPRLDSVGVEKVIGLFGFSLFGSLSLLPSTAERAASKDNLTGTQRVILVLSFALIWVLASVGLLCGLHGKSNFEQAVCRLTARLGILGLTLLVVLHLTWMLPTGTFATLLLRLHDRRCHTSLSVMGNELPSWRGQDRGDCSNRAAVGEVSKSAC
ncbi:hypothetical protein VPH35_046627 [Triticum aestivum]|uniref:vegetative cell wall protein gp1 n=1 Tax=Triticum aestivum TaxID=4565 RepID=UPI001D0263B1|nr:vegetative cell wall protein gp1-like [Triticum aestivum]